MNFHVGDKVQQMGSDKVYRIVAIAPVYGIPAADLIRVRKDGSDTVRVRRNYVNRPLSVLEKKEGN